MTGHVFHPGHSELHGITVIVETQAGDAYVGRYDREDEQGLHLLDVGVHRQESGLSRQAYLERSARFGVRSDHRHLSVPTVEVTRITRLAHWNGVPSS